MKEMVEKEGDGFYGAVDLQNRPVENVDKASVLNARILWTFSAAAKTWPGRGYEEMARKAYRIITHRFRDPEFGGYYMNLFKDHNIRESGHLGIFFSNDFSETEKSKAICSFGHDIEASWLIWEAAEILGEEQTKEWIKTGVCFWSRPASGAISGPTNTGGYKPRTWLDS